MLVLGNYYRERAFFFPIKYEIEFIVKASDI